MDSCTVCGSVNALFFKVYLTFFPVILRVCMFEEGWIHAQVPSETGGVRFPGEGSYKLHDMGPEN